MAKTLAIADKILLPLDAVTQTPVWSVRATFSFRSK
jgi:hypothetical protein